MKIEIEKPKNTTEEESVLFRIFKVTVNIKKAIELLKKPHNNIIVQNINSGANEKIYVDDIVYAEYLERSVFLYTKESAYSLRTSLTKFMEEYSGVFIQIKKNLVLNSYFLQSFAATKSGNLMATVSTGEKLAISRRYVKNLKDSLSKLSCAGYD